MKIRCDKPDFKMYLEKEKGCGEDETVVVMPSDPYTEAGYFRTIGRMAQAVAEGCGDLVLMGIHPLYASTKYGYIVPEGTDGDAVRRVRRFTEKPDETKARALIGEGALWNGGVFAFRLGYMLDIVRRYLQADTFDEARCRYGELPKISFDYEVAEKAQSVAVVPFKGLWKDLGTWDVLREGREGADGLRRGRPRLHGGGDPDAGQHGMVFPAAVLPVRVDHVPYDLLAVAAPRGRTYQAGIVVPGDVDRGRRHSAGADGLHR